MEVVTGDIERLSDKQLTLFEYRWDITGEGQQPKNHRAEPP